jgi:hypothetical protein
MTSRRRLPSSLEFLQAVHQAGGEVAYDTNVISVKFGVPRKVVRRYVGGCAAQGLIIGVDRGAGPILVLTPIGLDAAARKPVLKPSPPPPPSSAPQPQATRADDDTPVPLNEVQRIRLEKQRKEVRALARLRGVTKIDGVNHNRLYGDALELGRDAKLTALEYQRLKIMLGRFPVAKPEGFSMEQAKALRDDFNRAGRTEAKRRSRQATTKAKAAQVQTIGDLNPRASAILLVLSKPRTISQMAKVLRRHPAFLSSGNWLTERSLKRAIQRELDASLADRVEVTRDQHKNGWQMAVFRRR